MPLEDLYSTNPNQLFELVTVKSSCYFASSVDSSKPAIELSYSDVLTQQILAESPLHGSAKYPPWFFYTQATWEESLLNTPVVKLPVSVQTSAT